MRIMFCLGSLNKGGAERVVCNLANFFVGQGNDVAIVITKPGKREYVLNKKVEVFAIEDSEKFPSSFRTIRRICRLRRLVLDYKPSVVFGFLQEPIGRLVALKVISRKVRRVPTIISVRIDPKTAFNSIKRKISLLFYNQSDGFVFQTEDAKAYFNRRIQSRSIVIANPVDPSFFSVDNNVAKREHKIVAVGRLTEQKNYPMLIRAFQRVLSDFPDYVLEIFGEGPKKGELEELIRQLGLNKKVRLMGNTDNIKQQIRKASLFAMTSNYEGMSNALMEAMALGIPCISTDSSGGGARTLIEDGANGFLIPVNDDETMAKKMSAVLSNEELAKRISANSVKSMQKYSPALINDRWLKYTKKIIREKGM